MAMLSACGGSESDAGGDSNGSCAYVVKVDGTKYIATGEYADTTKPGPAVGDVVGTGEVVRCSQVENDPDAGKTATVHRIVGIDPKWAVAFGDNKTRAMILVIPQGDVPEDVAKKIKGVS